MLENINDYLAVCYIMDDHLSEDVIDDYRSRGMRFPDKGIDWATFGRYPRGDLISLRWDYEYAMGDKLEEAINQHILQTSAGGMQCCCWYLFP